MIEEQREIEQRWHRLLADDPKNENIRRAYEELHSFYLRTRGHLYPTAMDITHKVILRLVGTGKDVAEYGFGNGDLSCWLAKQGNTVIGIDISSKAVESARKKAADFNLQRWAKFQQGSATSSGLPGDSFDIALSQWVVEHIHPTLTGAHLKDVWRILKPNGAYIFITANKYDGATSLGMHLKEWGFAEMRRFVEQHGFVCYWLDTRIARLLKSVIVPPYMLCFPDLMEKVYARLPCARILRPNLFFLAKKVDK